MNTYGSFLNFSISYTNLQDSIQTLRANLHYQKNIESVFVSYRACVITHWKAIPVTFHLQRILSMAEEPMFSLLPVRLCHTAQWTCVGTTQQPIAHCLSEWCHLESWGGPPGSRPGPKPSPMPLVSLPCGAGVPPGSGREWGSEDHPLNREQHFPLLLPNVGSC